jgi:lipopolysaccharide export system protein LptA
MPPKSPPPHHAGLIAALLAAGLLSAPAFAEKADRDKPVEIEADNAEVDDKTKTTVFKGKVVITQGTLVIRGDKVTLLNDGKGRQSATALGDPATFRQKRDGADEYIEGRGQRMDYDSQRQMIQLRDNAEIRRGGDWARGQLIEYDSEKGTYRVVGDTQRTEGAPAGTGGRVRAVIQPRSAPADPQTR